MMTDADLLADYRATRSDRAFAEIVSRHAGMVLRTALRSLNNLHEAEDVTQAVFLVLAQRPQAVDRSLPGWLHEVTRRTAAKVARARHRRQRHEAAVARTTPAGVAVAVEDPAELREQLDGALARLPGRLREAVILRYLEGRDQEEAARLAGCPRATLVSRSSKGLDRLRALLSRRGATVSAGVLAAFFAQEATAAAVPSATIAALSSSLAAATTAKAVPTALFAKSAVKGMFWAKAQTFAGTVVAVATAGVAVTLTANALLSPNWKTLTTERATLTGHGGPVSSVAFSPDGQTLASGSYDGTAKLWDVAAAKERAHLSAKAGRIHRVAFTLDGKTVAAATDSRVVQFWDVSTGNAAAPYPTPIAGNSFVAFSPDRTVLATGLENDVKLWDQTTGQELATLRGHTEQVTPGSVFSPDGTLLATGSYDRTIRLWDVKRRETRFVLRGHHGCVPCVAFAPDGSRLASASWDKTIRLWDVASGQELLTLTGHARDVASVAFTPDGRTLVSGAWDQTMKLWDVASGRELATLGVPAEAVWRMVAVAPSGKTLAAASSDKTVKLFGR